MKITIICVGKIKEAYLQEAIKEYTKRLKKYVKLDIIEVQDEKLKDKMSLAEEENIKIKEGKNVLKKIDFTNFTYVVALDIEGKNFNSIELSNFIQNNMNNRVSNIYFIIGGSLGLSKEVLKKCNLRLSFSKMTFTHKLMKVILLEQIYRSFKIIKNEPYHK